MAKIAFLLLVHKDASRVIRQAQALTSHGDFVAVHADANMPASEFAQLKQALQGIDGAVLAKRVRCGWGEYSLVQATLNLIQAARSGFTGITHYFLLSGDCYPTKSRSYLERFAEQGLDHIEAHNFFETDWIKTGMKRDRLVYRHWFNERKRKRLFYASLNLQRKLGWRRPLPNGLQIHIGSQWWLLRAETVEKILGFLDSRRDIPKFFRTTWIPDETFFQTLVANLIPHEEISGKPPTSLLFSDYGMPVVFCADHHEFLRSQNQPFARKISQHSPELAENLLHEFESWDPSGPEGGGTPNIYSYLAGRGRAGLRYRRRFWERAIAPRRNAEVLIVSAKLWHVGRAIEQAAARCLNLQGLGYVFDGDVELGIDLGNLESAGFKRNMHRHAFLNLVFDRLKADRLLLAVDPSQIDVIDDVSGLAGDVRILMVNRPLTDQHLRTHARRVGLLTEKSGEFAEREILTALRHDFRASVHELRERYRGKVFLNDLSRPREENVTNIGHFLQVARAKAEVAKRRKR